MTHPSEKTPQNRVLDKIPTLGVFYPILPPLPPLGSCWMSFSLWMFSKQLQSGAIADLEAFGNIFRFWDFGISGQDSDISWLYAQLMNIDAPDASEHSHPSTYNNFSPLKFVDPDLLFLGEPEPQQLNPSALTGESRDVDFLVVESSNEAIEKQAKSEAIAISDRQKSTGSPILNQQPDSTLVRESRNLDSDVNEVGTLSTQDIPIETPPSRNQDQERSSLAHDLDTPTILQTNSQSGNPLWDANRQPENLSKEKSLKTSSASSDLPQVNLAFSENLVLETGLVSDNLSASGQETLSSTSVSKTKSQNTDSLEFQARRRQLSESSELIQQNEFDPAHQQADQPLSADIQNTQGLDDSLVKQAEVVVLQDSSVDDMALVYLETPEVNITKFSDAAAPILLKVQQPDFREDPELPLERDTSPYAFDSLANPTTELADSSLSAQNIAPETVGLNREKARNMSAETVDKHNEATGESETRPGQLSATSELSETLLSSPADERTDPVLAFQNNAFQSSEEFSSKHFETLVSQDSQEDSAAQSEPSRLGIHADDEISVPRSPEYLPGNERSKEHEIVEPEGGLLNWLNRGVNWVKSKFEGAESTQNPAHRKDSPQTVLQVEVGKDTGEGAKINPKAIRAAGEEPIAPSPAASDLENAPQSVHKASESDLSENASFTYPEERSQIFFSPPENIFNRVSTEASEQPSQDSAMAPSPHNDQDLRISEVVTENGSETLQAQSGTAQHSNIDIELPNSSNTLESTGSDLLKSGGQRLEPPLEDPLDPIQEDVEGLAQQRSEDSDHSISLELEQRAQDFQPLNEPEEREIELEQSTPVELSEGSTSFHSEQAEQLSSIERPSELSASVERPSASTNLGAEEPISYQLQDNRDEANSVFERDNAVPPFLELTEEQTPHNAGRSETIRNRPDTTEASTTAGEIEAKSDQETSTVNRVKAAESILSEALSTENSAFEGVVADNLMVGDSENFLQGADLDERTLGFGKNSNSAQEEQASTIARTADRLLAKSLFNSDLSTDVSARTGIETEPSVSTNSLVNSELTASDIEERTILQSISDKSSRNPATQQPSTLDSSELAQHELIHGAELESVSPQNVQAESIQREVSTKDEVSETPEIFSNSETSEFPSDVLSHERFTLNDTSATPVETVTFIQDGALSSTSKEDDHSSNREDGTSNSVQTEESISILEEDRTPIQSVPTADRSSLSSDAKKVEISSQAAERAKTSKPDNASETPSFRQDSLEAEAITLDTSQTSQTIPIVADSSSANTPSSSEEPKQQSSSTDSLNNSNLNTFSLEEQTIIQSIPDESRPNFATKETFDSAINSSVPVQDGQRQAAEQTAAPTQSEQAELIECEVSETHIEIFPQDPNRNAVLPEAAHRRVSSSEPSLQPLTEQGVIATNTESNFSLEHDPEREDGRSNAVQGEQTSLEVEEPVHPLNPNNLFSDSAPLHLDVEANANIVVEDTDAALDELQNLSNQSETSSQTPSLDSEQSSSEDIPGVEFKHSGIKSATIIQTITDENHSAVESSVTPLTSTKQASLSTSQESNPPSLRADSDTTVSVEPLVNSEQSVYATSQEFEVLRSGIEASIQSQAVADALSPTLGTDSTDLQSTQQSYDQTSLESPPAEPFSERMQAYPDAASSTSTQNEIVDSFENTQPEIVSELVGLPNEMKSSSKPQFASQFEHSAIAFEITSDPTQQPVEANPNTDKPSEIPNNDEALGSPVSLEVNEHPTDDISGTSSPQIPLEAVTFIQDTPLPINWGVEQNSAHEDASSNTSQVKQHTRASKEQVQAAKNPITSSSDSQPVPSDVVGKEMAQATESLDIFTPDRASESPLPLQNKSEAIASDLTQTSETQTDSTVDSSSTVSVDALHLGEELQPQTLSPDSSSNSKPILDRIEERTILQAVPDPSSPKPATQESSYPTVDSSKSVQHDWIQNAEPESISTQNEQAEPIQPESERDAEDLPQSGSDTIFLNPDRERVSAKPSLHPLTDQNAIIINTNPNFSAHQHKIYPTTNEDSETLTNNETTETSSIIPLKESNTSPTLQMTEQLYIAIENSGSKNNLAESNDASSDGDSDNLQPTVQSSINEKANKENISSDWTIASLPLAQNSGLLSNPSPSDFLRQNTYDQVSKQQAISLGGIKTSAIRLQQEDLEENLIQDKTISAKFDAAFNTKNISAESKSNSIDGESPVCWDNLEELVGSNAQNLNVIGLESDSKTQEKNKRIPDSWSNLEDLVNLSSKQFNSEFKSNSPLNKTHSEELHHGWSDLSSLIHSLKFANNNKISAESLNTHTNINNKTEEIKNDLFSPKENSSKETHYIPSRDDFIQFVVNEIQSRGSYDFKISLTAKALSNNKEIWITSQSKYLAPLDFSLIKDVYERICAEHKSEDLNLIVADLVESLSKVSKREDKDFSFSRKNSNFDIF